MQVALERTASGTEKIVNILLVSEDIPAAKLGGLGKHVVTLGNALIEAGHEVALMGRDTPSYSECAEEIGFRGRFIPGFGDPIKGWKERQLGFFNRWKRPHYAKRIAKAILVHSGNFHVVHYHGHFPMVGRYLPASVNFVQTRHDQGSDCITQLRFRNGDVCREHAPEACARCIHPHPGSLRTALSAAAVRRYRNEIEESFASHPVIFVSTFLRENYRLMTPNARLGKSAVIHNFVDESILHSEVGACAPDATESRVRIHVAGRLDEPKGIGAFLHLLVPILPEGWRIDVYGDGPLRNTIAAEHAGRAVRFHGHRKYDDVVRATRTASVVVVPSVLEESCGTVILEALRMDKVCYALRRGGTPELARYGATGQLRLFADLPTLVNALLTDSDFSVMGRGESADVHARLQQLLMLYASGSKGRQ
jgi:glycosyltransferase involved in cell wall biosynthesis